MILSADWHLRDDIPQCRERDEYLVAQERKLKFIHDLVLDNGATLLIAGDIFDAWKPSPWLISLAIRYIPPGTIVVPGQHDLPAHNLQELSKTGLQTLAEAGVAIILSGGLRRVLGHPRAIASRYKRRGPGTTPGLMERHARRPIPANSLMALQFHSGWWLF